MAIEPPPIYLRWGCNLFLALSSSCRSPVKGPAGGLVRGRDDGRKMTMLKIRYALASSFATQDL